MNRLPLYYLALLITGLHCLVYLGGYIIPVGSFHDPDSYLRMHRILELLNSGEWGNQFIHRANAPEGFYLHWSRPFDLIVLLIYFPFRLLADSPAALFYAGLIVSPLLLLPFSCCLQQLVKWGKISYSYGLFLFILFITQPGLLNYFQAARPDHHSLILLIFGIHGILTYLCLSSPQQNKFFIWNGVLTGLAFWISIESVTFWCAFTISSALLWLSDHTAARSILLYHASTSVSSLIFFLLEPPQITGMVTDRLSLTLIVLLFCITMGWACINAFSYRKFCIKSALSKLCLGTGSALLSVLIFLLIAPEFIPELLNPGGSDLKELWLNYVSEFQPLIKNGPDIWKALTIWMPSIPLGCAFIIITLIYRNSKIPRIGILHGTWLVYAIIFTALVMHQARWLSYSTIVWVIPAAGLLKLLDEKLCHTSKSIALRAYALAFVILFFPVTTTLLEVQDAHNSTPEYNRDKSVNQSVFEWLDSLEEESTVLAPLYLGPEILYRTDHSIIGSHHHRNAAGIMANYNILSAPDFEHSKQLLLQHGISWIVLDPSPTEYQFYAQKTGEKSLFHQLRTGNYPDFISEMDQIGQYRIYQVFPAQ